MFFGHSKILIPLISLGLNSLLFASTAPPASGPRSWLGKQIEKQRLNVGTTFKIPIDGIGQFSLRYEYGYVGAIKNGDGKIVGAERKDTYRINLSGDVLGILNRLGIAQSFPIPIFVSLSKELAFTIRRILPDYKTALVSLPRNPLKYFPFSADDMAEIPLLTRITIATSPSIAVGAGYSPTIPFISQFTQTQAGAAFVAPMTSHFAVSIEKANNQSLEVTTSLTKDLGAALVANAGIRSRAAEELSGISESKRIDKKVKLNILDARQYICPTYGVTAFSKYRFDVDSNGGIADSRAETALNQILRGLLEIEAEKILFTVNPLSRQGSLDARDTLARATSMADAIGLPPASSGVVKDISGYGSFVEREKHLRTDVGLIGTGAGSSNDQHELFWTAPAKDNSPPVDQGLLIQRRNWDQKFSFLFGLLKWKSSEALQSTHQINPATGARALRDLRLIMDIPNQRADGDELKILQARMTVLLGHAWSPSTASLFNSLTKKMAEKGEKNIELKNFHFEAALTHQGMFALGSALSQGITSVARGDALTFLRVTLDCYRQWAKLYGVKLDWDSAKIAQTLHYVFWPATTPAEQRAKTECLLDLIQNSGDFGKAWLGYFLSLIHKYGTPLDQSLRQMSALKWSIATDIGYSSDRDFTDPPHQQFVLATRKVMEAMNSGRNLKTMGSIDTGSIAFGFADEDVALESSIPQATAPTTPQVNNKP